MERKDLNSEAGSNSTQNAKGGNGNGTQSSLLMQLFEDQLKDMYWSEKALTKSIPRMIKQATSEDLKEALTNHLAETEGHITDLEEVFATIGKEAVAVKCDAMTGLIKEGEDIMDKCESGCMCDAGIISAAQKIEHYEIATYGTLRQFAETLGLTEAETVLAAILDEEKTADQTLTDIAVSTINSEAAEVEG